MKFESKKIDMTLDLVNGAGEIKVFSPKVPPSADLANKIQKEISMYQEAQKGLPTSEQDANHVFNLKAMGWIYKDFDAKWVSKNFTASEINTVGTWVNEQLLGLGKEEGN